MFGWPGKMIVNTCHGSVTTLVDANSRDIVTNPMTAEESVALFKSAMSYASGVRIWNPPKTFFGQCKKVFKAIKTFFKEK